MIMRRRKVSGGYLKPNGCIIEDSKHDNKPLRRLSNSSESSITGSVVSRKDWIICRQYNSCSDTMQIYSLLKAMDSILGSRPYIE